MFDRLLHHNLLVRALKQIYTNRALATVLGLKGGTAAFLFYDLPRFSVDLDFDLLNTQKEAVVFEELKTVLKEIGTIKQAIIKRSTIFFLVSYGENQRQLKVEVSRRIQSNVFEVAHYLGIPMLVASKPSLLSGKLAALLTRKQFASRDLFDLWFFLKNDWQFNEALITERLQTDLPAALKMAEDKVLHIKSHQLLQGLGELVDNKQKLWVKEKLVEETLFYIRLYRQNCRKS